MNPDFTGNWKANFEKSRLLGPAPQELLVMVFHSEPDLRVSMTITVPDQGPQHVDFRARTTGETATNSVLGTVWQSRLRWVGSELLIESWVSHPGRETHFCDYWSLSSDRRVMTMEHRNDDLPGQITVLDRTD
jgi:hypothetical protein